MYDAIIVGARVAGAPTAMLLARKGFRVLLVDRASFPSDVISGHYIHTAGSARLKRWGLLQRVADLGAPAVRQITFDVGPFALVGSAPPIDGVSEGYMPRRTVLDHALVEAATEAGAELRERFAVQELLWDGDRVVGIRGRQSGGQTITELAPLVIGADGTRSFVARSVEAPMYDTKPALTCSYMSYWSGVPVGGIELYPRDGRFIVAGPTNDGLTLVGVIWPIGKFHAVREDLGASFLEALDRNVPGLAERVRAGRREEPFRGTGDIPFFFRKPYGPGWALVGDAGYHMDPITAQGMTDAFRDADLLAEAIEAGLAGRRPLEVALADYERRRNDAAMPMYELTWELATLQPPPPEMQRLMAALRGNQLETDRFLGVMAGSVPVQEFYAPENIERIVAGAGLPAAA